MLPCTINGALGELVGFCVASLSSSVALLNKASMLKIHSKAAWTDYEKMGPHGHRPVKKPPPSLGAAD